MPNYHTIALISHASKVMLKILQASSKKRQRNQRSNCQHLLDHGKSKRVPEKHISALLTMPKPLTLWISINCGKFLKSWKYQTTWPASWEICMQDQEATVQTGCGTTDCFHIGKGVRQGCIFSPYLLICRVHHEKHWTGRNTSWNQDCREKYQ